MEAVKCEAFLAAAELGSLTATAELLGYTQSGVTRMIGTLEEELGFPLFLRSKKGVQLTENGKLMLPLLREVVRAHHNAEQLSAEIGGVSKGSLTIGCYYSISALWMPEILTAFRARYPGVRLRISNHSTPQAIAALRETTADFAVVTTPVLRAAAYTKTNIRYIQEVAVCAPSFGDLLGRKVTLDELRSHPLITLGADTQSYALYSGFFAAHSLPFRPDIEAFTADQILPMVESGLGVGIVPQDFIRPSDQVCVIDLVTPLLPRSVCLVKRKDQPLSVAARELEKMIIESGARRERGKARG